MIKQKVNHLNKIKTTDARQWSAALLALGKNIEEVSNNYFRLFALELYKNIALETPVDTGHARLNWMITRNKPSNNKRISKSDLNFSDSVSQSENMFMETIFIEGSNRLKKTQLKDKIYISSNVPYISEVDRLSTTGQKGIDAGRTVIPTAYNNTVANFNAYFESI